MEPKSPVHHFSPMVIEMGNTIILNLSIITGRNLCHAIKMKHKTCSLAGILIACVNHGCWSHRLGPTHCI